MKCDIDREMWIELSLLNGASNLEKRPWKESGRPPLFFISPKTIQGELREDQAVIYLPFCSAARISDSMDELVGRLIQVMRFIQGEGPYLLGGYCVVGYVAYEIAWRLMSSDQHVELLVLVECNGPGNGERIRYLRRLLLSIRYPSEGIAYAAQTLGKQVVWMTSLGRGASEGKRAWEIYRGLLNKVFMGYWRRLGQGRTAFPGRVVLIFGERSPLRFMPARGWRRLLGGSIEVLPVPGNHEGLFRGDSLPKAIVMSIYGLIENNKKS